MPAPNPIPNFDLNLAQLRRSLGEAGVRGEVRKRLAAGRYLVLIGRNSGEKGRDPAEAAVQSLFSGLDSLAAQGLDYRPYVPSRAELLRRLRTEGETVVSKAADGQTFRNTFLTIDLAPLPLVLLLSTGTARKLDENSVQPFNKYAAEVVRNTRAGCVYAARIDRITRHRWAIADVMMALEQVDGYIGDERGIFAHPNGPEAFQLFVDASTAQSVADLLPAQSRRGQIAHTDAQMVGGRARYGVGSAPPAGLARCRMKRGASDGDSEIFLEMPGVLPDPSEVSYGLPEVFDDDGRHVDQVANVMWALSVWKTDDWSDAAIIEELIKRKFSTAGLRSLRDDPKASWGSEDAAAAGMLSALQERLDFYETGTLECVSSKFDPIVVEGILPPQGYWATPVDFARIRVALAEGRSKFSARAKRTFAGLRLDVNGTEARMYHREGSRFRIRAIDAGRDIERCVDMTHGTLAGAIVEAIGAAGDAAIQLVPIADDRLDPELRKLAEERRPLAIEETAMADRLTALSTRLEQVGPDEQPLLSGALLKKVNDDYNELADRAEKTRARIENLDRRADARRSELRSDATTARVDRLLQMVASLKDPADLTYRNTWRTALQDLAIITTPTRAHGHDGRNVELSGWLRVGNGGEQAAYRIPISATWRTGPVAKVERRVESIIDGMRHGTPYCDSRVPRAEALRIPLVEALDPFGRLLAACDDPRIVRIAMAVTVDRAGRSLDQVASGLGEPLALVERVADRFVPSTVRGSWYRRGSAMTAALYELAACHDGFVSWDQVVPNYASSQQVVHSSTSHPARRGIWKAHRNQGLELVARCLCDPSAVPWFAEMVIAEPLGPVCRRCWTDRAGIPWPEAQYGRFILEKDDHRSSRRTRRRR